MSLPDSTIEEPTMIGDTPEDRLRAAKRRRRMRMAAVAVVVIVAVAVGIALLPNTANDNVSVDPLNSKCTAGGTFSCTVVLNAKPGATITPSMIKTVQINYTTATTTVQGTSGRAVTVVASVPLVPMEHCRPDIGCSLQPPKTGDVVVFLTDGTSVSVVLGAGGILK